MPTPSSDKLQSWAMSVGLWPGAPKDPHFLPGGVGPRFIPITFDFTANGSNGAAQHYDLTLPEMEGLIGSIQGCFIDNSQNITGPLTVKFPTGGQMISIPKGAQCIMPIFEPSDPLRFVISTTGLFLIPTLWVNVPVAPHVWAGS